MTLPKKKSPGADARAGPGADFQTVRWDKAETAAYRTTFFNVVSKIEHIALLFGNAELVAGTEEVAIKLGRQIILSPFVAKQLCALLDDTMKHYESRFGPIPGATEAETRQEHQRAGVVKSAADAIGTLIRTVESLSPKSGFERSLKVTRNRILDNRFLVGVSTKVIGPAASSLLVEACGLLDMPKNLIDIFTRHLPLANYVHFGFEEDENKLTYKVYLEFFETIKGEIEKRKERPEQALLHLGLKWDVADPSRQTVTRYIWYPWISSDEIVRRASAMVEGAPGLDDAARNLVSLALARIPSRDILYLEVTEEGNPRRSFDINVYRADLQIAEAYPLLSVLCRRHGVSYQTFHSLYDTIKTKKLGHLAGGKDRQGSPFFTVYYGVEGLFGGPERPSTGDESCIARSEYGNPTRKQHLDRAEKMNEEAGTLRRLVKGLGVRSALERSFKFLTGTVLSDRYLMVCKRPMDGSQDAAMLGVCRGIGMPHGFESSFRAELPEAENVLFGFEQSEKGGIYKVYLEFTARLREALKEAYLPKSVTIFDGFKWRASDAAQKMKTVYTAFNILSAPKIAEKLFLSFKELMDPTALRIADEFIDLAGSRTQPGELLYFEAAEEDNPRKSFDVNIYQANLRMAEVYPLLLDAARHFFIDISAFEDLYSGVKKEIIGHVSGGIDREGRDFLTFYFGKKRSIRLEECGRG